MKKISSFFLLVIFFLSLCMGQLTFTYTKDALILWFEKLVPSLFISMVLVRILFEQQVLQIICKPFHMIIEKIFRIDENSFTLVVSSIFLGYPTGSILIDQQVQQGSLSHQSAKRLLYTCSFATPGFIIMSCGVVLFHSPSIGWKLLFIQLLCGFILLFFTRSVPVISRPTQQKIPTFMQSLSKALLESGKTLYLIGGYLMLFMTLTSLIFHFLPEPLSFFLRSLSEFSSGIISIASTSLPQACKLIFISMLLGFGGCCVHMQVMNMLEAIHIPYYKYFLYRLAQAILSGIFAYFIFT